MSRDFAFVQTASGGVFVGWGPFEQLPFRRPDRPAFFVTDFFLDEPRPWLHPSEWEEVTIEELAARFESDGPAEVEWKHINDGAFISLFSSALNGIDSGDFKKIVPITFEHGRFKRQSGRWSDFISRLTSLASGLWAYGFSFGENGVIGATPEVLFQSHGRGYRTMALAGTRPLSRAPELLTSAKELREHRFVVDDIARRLAPFGNVEIGALGIMNLPAIAHLSEGPCGLEREPGAALLPDRYRGSFLLADGRNNGNARGRNGPRDDFLIEWPQIFETSATARDE
jgi:isochorismate synthase EntC